MVTATSAAAALVLAACAAPNDGGTAPASLSPAINSPISPSSASTRLVGPSEFAAAIDEPARVLINVHVPYEGDIPGTDLSIPFDQIGPQASKLPTDRNTPLAVYCRSGRMTAIAAETLNGLGYENVVELQGGMQAWEASGHTVTVS